MNVREILLGYKFYDGVSAAKKLSASQVSKDLLELYLAATETAQPRNGWSRGHIGSVFHLGMEEIFKKQKDVIDGRYVQEKRFSKTLQNGWQIDGKMDMIDFMDHIIFDWKGMSASAYKEFKKNDKTHKINVQMSVYNWLLGGNFECQAHVFITDWDPVNAEHPAQAYQIVECDIIPKDEIELYMLDKTYELQKYLDAKKAPPECADVMPRYVTKTKEYINSKCEFYCDYSHVCPKKRKTSAVRLGLDWSRN